MCPDAQGLDAGWKNYRSSGYRKQSAWSSGQACDYMCRNECSRDRSGPGYRELCMLGASLRVQVWLLKHGDPNSSVLNHTKVGISLTQQFRRGWSPCSKRSWRNPGTNSFCSSTFLRVSPPPVLSSSLPPPHSSWARGLCALPFMGPILKRHTCPHLPTPHWPECVHLVPPAAGGAGSTMCTSEKAIPRERNSGHWGQPEVCPTRPKSNPGNARRKRGPTTCSFHDPKSGKNVACGILS